MAKHILIDSGFGLVRTAISQNGKLLDYYEESPDQGRSKGNIYKGLVKKVDPHIQAAFVRYGGGKDGFLPLRDEASRGRDEASRGSDGGGTRKKGGAGLGPGDSVVVQVVKDEVGAKGAALTTKLSLSGRYLVYMPHKDGEGGVSSRLTDDERAAMKKALADLQVPEGASVILRTAALNKPTEELQADLDRLLEAHREIEEQAYDRKEPGLLFREAPPAFRYLREYYTPDVERIWVNSEEVLEQCRQFFNLYEPRSAAKVSLSRDGAFMFQKLGLEAEVEKLSARKVPLPSGANFVIDQTEALVAIDVNSAKSKAEGAGRGKDLEATAFAINMEAGAEIARQLRLRDLGGIIVVDFIDMEEERHRRKLEEAMRRALAEDKAKIKVYDISPLGLMQISRQRLRKAGPHFSRAACEACHGRGWHASPAAAAYTVLRRIEEKVQGRQVRGLSVSVPFPVANFLLNDFRSHVLELEARHGCGIRIQADAASSGEAIFAAGEPAGERAGRGEGSKAEERGEGKSERRSEGKARRGGEAKVDRRGEGRLERGGEGKAGRRGEDRKGEAEQLVPAAVLAGGEEGGEAAGPGRADGRRRGRAKAESAPVQVEWREPEPRPAVPPGEMIPVPPPPSEEPPEAVLDGETWSEEAALWSGEAALETAPVLDIPPPTEEPAMAEPESGDADKPDAPAGQGPRRGRGRGGRGRRGGREGREPRERSGGQPGREARAGKETRAGREPRREAGAAEGGKPSPPLIGPSGRQQAAGGNRGDTGRRNAPPERGGRKGRQAGSRPVEAAATPAGSRKPRGRHGRRRGGGGGGAKGEGGGGAAPGAST